MPGARRLALAARNRPLLTRGDHIAEQLVLGGGLPSEEERAETIRSLLPGRTGGAITGVFARMGIAEEEIEAAQSRYPLRKAEVWSAFLLLQPPPVLEEYPDHLYRAHCREILNRVATGGDPRWATDAEMLAGFCEALARAPLREDGAALMWRVFQRVYPEANREERFSQIDFRESYPGRTDELETEARRSLRREERKL